MTVFSPGNNKNQDKHSSIYLHHQEIQVERNAISALHTSSCSGQPTEQFVKRRRGTHHHCPYMWDLRGEPGGWGPGGEVTGCNTSAWLHDIMFSLPPPTLNMSYLRPTYLPDIWVWFQSAKTELYLVCIVVVECLLLVLATVTR